MIALERLLKTNKGLVTGPAHVKPDEAIYALLRVRRKPTDVAQVLVSLRSNKHMKYEADELHRQLLVVYKNHPTVVFDAWKVSGLDPTQLFEVLGLHWKTIDDGANLFFDVATAHYVI